MAADTRKLYVDVMKMTALLVLVIALCRFTKGYFSIIMVALGVSWAFSKQYGKALVCYAVFPLLICINYYILSKSGVMGIMVRIGPLLIGVILAMTSFTRYGHHRLPLGHLFLYLAFAAVSSIQGYAPMVSYLKLLQFVFFLLGIWIGMQNLENHPEDIAILRTFMLAFAVLVAFGSLATLPFPAIAYPLDITMGEIYKNYGMDAANEYFADHAGGVALFAGITAQSQMLGAITACLFVLTLADMVFIERRKTLLHVSLCCILPLLMFMTRSRTSLLSLGVGTVLVLLYAAKRVQLNPVLKSQIRRMASGLMFVGLLVVLAMEFRSHTFTRWIRKTDDLHDERSLSDALFTTRSGLIEKNMEDFRYNYILGCGFQVNADSRRFGNRIVLSAPIEKGVTPLMILGEGGILGATVFVMFLMSFYGTCARKHYFVTIATFSTFMAVNMGEATIFSPGGCGGIMWVISAVGGFTLDTLLLYRRNLEKAIMWV